MGGNSLLPIRELYAISIFASLQNIFEARMISLVERATFVIMDRVMYPFSHNP